MVKQTQTHIANQTTKRLIQQQFDFSPKLQPATHFLRRYLNWRIKQEYDNIINKLQAEILQFLNKGYTPNELHSKWIIDGNFESYGIYLHCRELRLCTPHASVYVYKFYEYDVYYNSHLYNRKLNVLGSELKAEREALKVKEEAEYNRLQLENEFKQLVAERNKLLDRVAELKTRVVVLEEVIEAQQIIPHKI